MKQLATPIKNSNNTITERSDVDNINSARTGKGKDDLGVGEIQLEKSVKISHGTEKDLKP